MAIEPGRSVRFGAGFGESGRAEGSGPKKRYTSWSCLGFKTQRALS